MAKIYKDILSFRAAFAVFLSFFVLGVPAVGVFAAKGDLTDVVSPQSSQAPLRITLGKADLIDVPGAVADVLIADPSLIDVMAIQSNRLYVVGLRVGDTNIIALDDVGNVVKRLDVHVSYDLQAIQSVVDDLFPGEAVQVRSVHDQILLTGTVSGAGQASKIANVVASYVGDLTEQSGSVDELISNLLEVQGEQQVMLKVKILEASRAVLRELGVETDFNDPVENIQTSFYSDAVTSVSQGSDLSEFAALASDVALSEDPLGVLRLVEDTGINGIGQISFLLEALEEQNLVNVLAEPNLTAVSGEQAGFLAGGEFPVPVGRDNVGNIVIEFREFGVSLNFRPTVLSSDRISLQMNTEVSSLDFESAIVLSDLTVPGLDIRRADTTVEMASGKSLMIAGLLQSEAAKGMTGLPGVSKAPILGDLISSDSFQRDETELVVIVTPYLVAPYQDKDVVDDKPIKDKKKPLESAFLTNIRRSYAFEDEGVLSGDGSYGYLLD